MAKDEDGVELTPRLPGMTPWMCSYDAPGGRKSITLYGTGRKQVLEDNCAELQGLTVDGISYGSIPVPKHG